MVLLFSYTRTANRYKLYVTGFAKTYLIVTKIFARTFEMNAFKIYKLSFISELYGTAQMQRPTCSTTRCSLHA